jgi:hypothetical protein
MEELEICAIVEIEREKEAKYIKEFTRMKDEYEKLKASHGQLLQIVRNTYLIGITNDLSYINAVITRAEKL